MKYTLRHPDTIGAINSSLCVAHCFSTPFLFLGQAQTSLVEFSTVPLWWQLLNYVFIVISFFAVKRTVKNSSNQLVKSLLWVSWVLLTALILNEEFEITHMPELLTYFAGMSLAALHVYNLKYCQCEDENCCPPKK